MNIFDIDREIASLVDPETGEIADYEAFVSLKMDRDAKCENVALWIKNLNAEARAIRDEEKSLAERRKAAEGKSERLTRYLELALQGETFKTAKVAVTYRKSTGVFIDDETAFMAAHPEFTRTKVELDKAGLKDALKAGTEITGACLEDRINMQIK